MIFVLLLLVQTASPRYNLSGESAGTASKEIPGDEDPYRWLPIGRSDRSLGKVKMSDSYATIALHSADMVHPGSGQQESKRPLVTTGSRTINSQLEVALPVDKKDSFTAEKTNSHGLFSTVYTGRTTSADGKRYNSIGPQQEEESLESESDGLEQVQKSAINRSTPGAPPRGPIAIKFWPKCCSMGEILYLPSPPLRPVCEVFEGPRLACPSLLQGLGLDWGRDKMLPGGQGPPSCRSGEQVRKYNPSARHIGSHIVLFKVETVASEDFIVQGGELGPGLLVKTLALSLPFASFCLEHGIQGHNGAPPQLFAQVFPHISTYY